MGTAGSLVGLTIAIPHRRLLDSTGYLLFGLLGWFAVLIPSLVRSVEHDFGQPDTAVSLLYFLSSGLFAAGALSGGFVAERLGRRGVLIAGICIAGAGGALAAAAPEWWLFVLGGTLSTGGAGLIEPQVTGLFLDLYPDARASSQNVLNAFFSIGSLVAPALVGLLVSVGVPWRLLVLATGFGFLAALPALILVRMPSGRRAEATSTHGASGAEQGEQSLLPFAYLAIAIGCYVGAEFGITNWLVRLLAGVPLIQATAVLSAFWGGLTLGRFASNWIAERLEYSTFTVVCVGLASLFLAGAVWIPSFPVEAVLFTLAGACYGPVFPMIMAIGGSVYPHRIAALSGGLTTAASAGAIIYPPLMGVLASRIGLAGGMFGAALLGAPMVVALYVARRTAQR